MGIGARLNGAPWRVRTSELASGGFTYVFGIYKALQILLPELVIAEARLNREDIAPTFPPS